MPKIVGIIQARMGSERLPGKILKMLAGKPMLWHIVERLKRAQYLNAVVVATTISAHDDAVAEFCEENNYLFYRGSEENVLERFYQTAQKYDAEVVVRITADCPLIDPYIVDQCVDQFAKCNCDYLSNVVPGPRTFPRGLDAEVFSFGALAKAFKQAEEEMEAENVTSHIWQNKKNEFRLGPTLLAEPAYDKSYRLTVDYPEDFSLIERIYQEFYKKGEIIHVPEVLKFLDAHPEIAAINADMEAKQKVLK